MLVVAAAVAAVAVVPVLAVAVVLVPAVVVVANVAVLLAVSVVVVSKATVDAAEIVDWVTAVTCAPTRSASAAEEVENFVSSGLVGTSTFCSSVCWLVDADTAAPAVSVK